MLLLSPYAPHLAEELWSRMGHTTSLAYEPWPEADESLLVVDSVKLPVQVCMCVHRALDAPVRSLSCSLAGLTVPCVV